jgi:hypothetical protein
MTGIPDDTTRRICSALRTPPSSFTAWARASFMKRTAVARAWSGPDSYDPNGRSATTSARSADAATARARGMSSSTVTGTVVSYPSTVLPAESPTRRKSMPASSKTPAVSMS